MKNILILLAAAVPASAQVTLEQVREEIRKELGSAARPVASGPAAFNPAFGAVIDTVAKSTRRTDSHFEFRGAELNFSADVDPRAKAYVIVNAQADEVELEEAAAVFHSLPGRFSVRAGRYFANFGRLPRWHDHELPFVERTESLDSFVNGEARTEGVEVSHLFGTPFFLRAALGAGNKLGAENDRLEETDGDGHVSGRPLNAFTYNASIHAYAPLGEAWGADASLSAAVTPRQHYVGGVRANEPHTARTLTGAELTLRWEPGLRASKLTWGTEVFRNDERRRVEEPAGSETFVNDRRRAWGGYTYAELRFHPLWSAGAFGDYAENLVDRRTSTRTFGGFVNLHVSGFNRIRLQVDRRRDNAGGRAEVRGLLQLTATIGRHAHTFKDR